MYVCCFMPTFAAESKKTSEMKKLLFFCCLLPIGIQAQTVSGKLIDEQNHPLPYANVVLLSLPDSAYATGTADSDTCLALQTRQKPMERTVEQVRAKLSAYVAAHPPVAVLPRFHIVFLNQPQIGCNAHGLSDVFFACSFSKRFFIPDSSLRERVSSFAIAGCSSPY